METVWGSYASRRHRQARSAREHDQVSTVQTTSEAVTLQRVDAFALIK